MKKLCLAAFAKINLFLYITGKLSNGYHTLSTVMQSIDLHDTVTISLIEAETGIQVTCSDSSLSGENNLAYLAAKNFVTATGNKDFGIQIYIEKSIPFSAGLGGGSADAAAVLVGLNQLMGMPLAEDQLMKLALSLGADVPFCLIGGTCLAEGIGEVLMPLHHRSDAWLVLVKPCQKESTAAMYQKYDEIKGLQQEKSCVIMDKIRINALNWQDQQLHNDFLDLYEDSSIHQCMEALLREGAAVASLSGSGPTLFGVFEDYEKARRCSRQLGGTYGWSQVCRFASQGWQAI